MPLPRRSPRLARPALLRRVLPALGRATALMDTHRTLMRSYQATAFNHRLSAQHIDNARLSNAHLYSVNKREDMRAEAEALRVRARNADANAAHHAAYFGLWSREARLLHDETCALLLLCARDLTATQRDHATIALNQFDRVLRDEPEESDDDSDSESDYSTDSDDE